MTERFRRDGGRLHTLNLVPGERVYGERLSMHQGREFREWSPRRSKLAAYLLRGGRNFRAQGDEHVLYLGAASGTTASHVSDLVPNGRVTAVEVSARPFRDLLRLSSRRSNLVPVLSDATQPDSYAPFLLHRAPLLYQDVAQRNQAQIFSENARRFLSQKGLGFLAVKARSIDVAAPPRRTYEAVQKELGSRGFQVIETVELDPFETDHAMMVVRGH